LDNIYPKGITVLDHETEEYPLVTFQIKGSQYAISSEHVSTMLALPEITPVPQAPHYVRGVINLRGEVLPLVDLRIRLGLASTQEELQQFCGTMTQRKQDHFNWLNELESSISEERPFTLTTDPHQCAFGKWYDTYKPSSLMAENILKKFNTPHRKIHAVAEKANALVASGNMDGAHALIKKTRGKELNRMVNLFGEICTLYNEEAKEIVLVVEGSAFNFALAVDVVDGVEFLSQDSINELPEGLQAVAKENLVDYIGKRNNSQGLVQVLFPDRICEPMDLMVPA
jgi:chemotaxis signal transduction protein